MAGLLALACALVGLALRHPGSALVRASYDSYFRWLRLVEGAPADAPVVVVYLDLESYLRERQDPARPWPRALHAQLVRRLTAAGARAVVFDIVFDTPGPAAAADTAFAAALAAHGRTVLAGELSVSSQRTSEGAWPRATRLVLPAEPLRTAATAWGLGEVAVDEDFVARRHFAGRWAGADEHLSLTWAAGRVLGLDSVRQPAASPERWLRYYGPPFALPHVSFSQALDPQAVADAVFRDKVVFVGARPMAGLLRERRDEFRSPFRAWRERDLFMPGVEVHATQMLNLIRGDWLTRPDPRTEAVTLLLTGALCGLGLIGLRPVWATMAALGGGGAVALGAVALHRGTGVWFPWLIVVGAQLPLALSVSLLHHTVGWVRTRRRLEAAQREAETRIREQAALLEKAHDAILVRDLAGRLTYANPSAERLFGWSKSELQAEAAANLFADAAAARAQHQALERGEWNGELRQATRDGRILTLESRWTLLRDDQGRPRGLLIINSDATEKKQLEAESLRLQRMEAIGALAGGMAHDLNNALAPILMGTQLLRRDARDENSRRILSLMESSTRRGAEMVRQVLLFARGRQGDLEKLDLRPLVKEMERLARDTFPPNITVVAHVAEDLWPVRGNPTQLHQVLLNLSVNARDAMPDGGALSLAADNVELDAAQAHRIPGGRPGPFVVLMVSDTGSGIPPELMPRIFEPFFTTKPEGRGTGLGLSTTARIVKAHDGFITVQSRCGEGTTFEVYLPRFADAPPEASQAAVAAPPRGQGQTLLVAEDEDAVLELLRRALEDHGYRVICAANGAEAVSLFRTQSAQVALVITDQSMPVLDGEGAVTAMREIRGDLPAILLSSDEPARPVEANPDVKTSRLSKPVALEELLRAVAQALAR
ncbi:MAG TPA: CHASE2 domain-containing protein [Methylomirabilota bacterium]|nr:CHASE2 domain-containing protein [Methylomirabilota bacterium]